MTTLPRLLSSLLLLGISLSGQVMASDEYCPKKFDVLFRTKKDKYEFRSAELEKLFCTNRFEGEHFKIVYSTDDEAISFNNENKDLLKKAANVYFHLTKARNFWISEIKSDYVQKLPQLTIRLDITNAFSSTRQFKNAEQEKNYNNAWTIPEGMTPSFAHTKKKWGKEIWFSPMKVLENRKEIKSEGHNPVHESLNLIKDPVIDYNKSALIYQGLNLVANPTMNQSLVVDDAVARLGTIAIILALSKSSYYMDKWFMEKYYFIETAMVPEIIYHEYAHIAMSDTMKTVHSVPVIEGIADYFATRIANHEKMYDHLKGYSNNNSKDTLSRTLYHPYLEGSWNATSDFTLSLLWAGKKEFDARNDERKKKGQVDLANYDEIVHNAHFHMNEDSSIMNDLTEALINSCEKSCDSKRLGINSLHRVFEKKGLN